ncbi:hypothetical protein Cgig2_030233 [Carnegiea gigantea]|uniref:Uncharacterized protein n=1 Tax=Carnegiea gigantea TaxID=171969 RepID=A0A9Q1KGB9_9CARY|nr:hypothetical protein Cgig2_030233 [Carnegiea gigantea]
MLLTQKRNWGLTFLFRGRSTFMIGVIEWIKRVLTRFEEPLKQAGIFGAIGERIGELPTLGATYEEFLPLNKDLAGDNKYPSAVAELLHIHAKLYAFHKVKHVYYDLWLDHFYREYLVYFAFGEQADHEKEKFVAKKRNPVHISYQERMANLRVIKEGELTTF